MESFWWMIVNFLLQVYNTQIKMSYFHLCSNVQINSILSLLQQYICIFLSISTHVLEVKQVYLQICKSNNMENWTCERYSDQKLNVSATFFFFFVVEVCVWTERKKKTFRHSSRCKEQTINCRNNNAYATQCYLFNCMSVNYSLRRCTQTIMKDGFTTWSNPAHIKVNETFVVNFKGTQESL